MKVKKNKNLDQTIFKIKFLLSEIWNSGKYVREVEDKMLEKVERYVDKNREKTSQEIQERKNKRPVKQYQE